MEDSLGAGAEAERTNLEGMGRETPFGEALSHLEPECHEVCGSTEYAEADGSF